MARTVGAAEEGGAGQVCQGRGMAGLLEQEKNEEGMLGCV